VAGCQWGRKQRNEMPMAPCLTVIVYRICTIIGMLVALFFSEYIIQDHIIITRLTISKQQQQQLACKKRRLLDNSDASYLCERWKPRRRWDGDDVGTKGGATMCQQTDQRHHS